MTKCKAAASTGCVTLVQPAGEANDAKSLHAYPVTRSILEHAQTLVTRLSLPPPPLIEPVYEARHACAITEIARTINIPDFQLLRHMRSRESVSLVSLARQLLV